jgi:SHS2 domain-containing protein
MELKDIKVLPQRNRSGAYSRANFEAEPSCNYSGFIAQAPPPSAPAGHPATLAVPPAVDSVAVQGLPLDSLGIYPCDTRRRQFEFLDHTADVQIHSWGDSFAQAAEQAVIGMFNYISDTSTVHVDASLNRRICAAGHDLQSLLYNFMSDWLFEFCGNEFMPMTVRITECDLENFRIISVGAGDRFDRGKHVLGTEVKAITYSAMQINQRTSGCYDIYVIVDI